LVFCTKKNLATLVEITELMMVSCLWHEIKGLICLTHFSFSWASEMICIKEY
jgi:hypothetical protein